MMVGRYDEALLILEPLIDAKSLPQLRLLLAEAYLITGNREMAEAGHRDIADFAGRLVKFGFAMQEALAVALARLGELERSLEEANDALRMKPGSPLAHWARTYIYTKSAQIDELYTALEAYAETHPGPAARFMKEELSERLTERKFAELHAWLREKLEMPPAEASA